jgi:outer membrane protein OmpA-like peptidoglycan-associated protein
MNTAKATLVLLALSAALVPPVSANWFADPRSGRYLNVGSAPNPVVLRPLRFAEIPPAYVPPPPAPPAPPPMVVQPPPQAAPAPPPPAPPPAPQMFVVFFDFDRADLSEEARDIVRRAVGEARRQGSVRVFVTGHTDTVGSRAYNQRLSERRALAVKNEMVRGGLDEDEITTVGRNFSDPLVPTGPGIREPQNRRAVIDIGGLIS